jgi:hypothetical protein
MAQVKPEEISHPPMEQLQACEYCIDSNPPWGASEFSIRKIYISVGISLILKRVLSAVPGEAIILGFQHYILALGTAVMIPSVLVPMMGGNDVSPVAATSYQFLAASVC